MLASDRRVSPTRTAGARATVEHERVAAGLHWISTRAWVVEISVPARSCSTQCATPMAYTRLHCTSFQELGSSNYTHRFTGTLHTVANLLCVRGEQGHVAVRLPLTMFRYKAFARKWATGFAIWVANSPARSTWTGSRTEVEASMPGSSAETGRAPFEPAPMLRPSIAGYVGKG